MAICGSGGAEGEAGVELGCRRVGRDRAQDSTIDPEDEEQDLNSDAVESGGLEWD